MKKFLNFVFNFFWVIIVGISSVITSAINGIACMVTIIGIPFGLQHFKFIPLVFAPAGKTVITHYGSHPVMNTIWLLFGGLVTSIAYMLLTFVCMITVIGIPLGLQLYKIVQFNFAPFGVEIVGENQFTSERNTHYDYILAGKKIVANPDITVAVKEDGTPVSAKEYFAPLAKKYNDFMPKYQQYKQSCLIEFGVSTYGILAVSFFPLLYGSFTENRGAFIFLCINLVAIVAVDIVYGMRINKLTAELSYFCNLDSQFLAPLIKYFEGEMPRGKLKKFPVSGRYKEQNKTFYNRFNTDNVWAGVYKELYAKEIVVYDSL